MRNGRRYSVSTRCTDEDAALREYRLWQEDPEGYRLRGGEERLAIDDDLIDLYAKDCSATPFVLDFPHHKSKGAPHRIAVDKETAAAAHAALARGPFNRMLFYRAFGKACTDAKVKVPFTPGDYRHTLATEMVESGADVGAVSAFLGHRSTATTKKFYATMAVVPNPRALIRQKLSPPLEASARRG